MAVYVNGKEYEITCAPTMRLVDFLREELGLTGTKEGCGEGECGACTVLLEGNAVASCLVLVGQVDGKSIITVEGLAEDNQLSALQQAFVDKGAIQCGFCTPGMLLSAKALLDQNPTPTRDEISVAIEGNLCRCTGYVKIIDAIEAVSRGEYR
ncbi:(2Fe-2S)-binding protein [Veillonella magna]|uniref:(2Fe-2S)-binding protein n=1 Tax=Veillonella magna TaxID=464322 RepID=A0ABS2GGX3_9FIRM|nr:(2Fe-2S)-binding protein [Veillonella magna]MBM6825112.1 (2Fe-2S)-binding protein [Veillonella magna]MBM6913406.1 (2Fe-2S)-binding protein [Veillonella magna]